MTVHHLRQSCWVHLGWSQGGHKYLMGAVTCTGIYYLLQGIKFVLLALRTVCESHLFPMCGGTVLSHAALTCRRIWRRQLRKHF